MVVILFCSFNFSMSLKTTAMFMFNVKADLGFSIDKSDLMDKLEKYKDHHLIIDEVIIRTDSDIDLIKRVSEKCQSNLCWVTVVNVWGKRFKLPQLTHESFLTIDPSCKIFF